MICIPIKPLTTFEAIKQMERVAPEADIIEVWLDRIEDLNLPEIISKKKKPLLFVNKPVRERGSFQGSEEKRVEILIEAAKAGADYLDLGLDTNEELIKQLISNKNQSKIILSYHNFTKTPSLDELLKIAQQAFDYGAHIIKIATTAAAFEDNLIIFNLIDFLKQKEKKIIALCMGDKGKISRVYGEMIGNFLTFALLGSEGMTAPGQLTLEQLKRIWAEIGYKTIY